MKHILLIAAAFALAACATPSGTSSNETAQAPEKEYRTGSRIPVRDSSASSTSPVKSLDPAALGPGAPARTN